MGILLVTPSAPKGGTRHVLQVQYGRALMKQRKKVHEMKKFMAILTLSAVTALPSFAAGTIRDNCGCGLGTELLGEKEPTLVFQLCATFLNGLCANQTFGISSGTLGCNPNSGFAQNEQVQEFVAGNMDRIAVDMAAGQGESLNALADLMNIPADQRASTFAKLQGSFGTIFPSSDITSQDVVTNIDKVLNG